MFVIAAIPQVLANDAAAGWNIFLGLLLFGAIASGNRRAPLLVLVLTTLMVLRSGLALIGREFGDAATSAALALLLAVAWRGLWRQAALRA
jgi:uncharacterized membrane protein YhaH (DUF805 family)